MKKPGCTSSIRKKLLLVMLGVSLGLGALMSYVAYDTINTMLFVQRQNNTVEAAIFAENILFNSQISLIADIAKMDKPNEAYEATLDKLLSNFSPTKVDRLTIYRPEQDGSQTLLMDVEYKEIREVDDYKWEFVAGKNVSLYSPNEIIVEKEEDVSPEDLLIPEPLVLGYAPTAFDNPLLVHDQYVFTQVSFFKENVVIKAVTYRSSIEGVLWDTVTGLLLSTWGALAAVTLVIVLVTQRLIAIPIRRLTGNVTGYKHGDGSQVFFEDVRTNDEIEILSGAFGNMVNDIEAYIRQVEELCETYYKFVPVQFLQYLGKQEISDVELGDAVAMNFGVLFCDIRGFSQKSETMSAVENFSFVNQVFGVAGPIIREYDGFIVPLWEG